jgi:hypothetical protein
MSFNIGTRVKSRFCGEGTITGELQKLREVEDNKVIFTFKQRVRFDLPVFGERDYEIKKLQSLAIEVEDGS